MQRTLILAFLVCPTLALAQIAPPPPVPEAPARAAQTSDADPQPADIANALAGMVQEHVQSEVRLRAALIAQGRALQAARAEVARLTDELAKARAVPAGPSPQP